jgi:tRNA (guanine-N7-)-methyltransferase
MPQPAIDLRPYFTALDEVEGLIDWTQMFGNANSVELDIGCGRGKFLYDSAIDRPETNWLGLELDFTEGRRGAKRLAKRELPNGRIIGGDAVQFISNHVRSYSVDAAHVYFPDPWWKRKHAKRRLFTDEFANLLSRVVKHDGYVHSWTDVGDYFEVISALMNHHPDFVAMEPAPEPAGVHDEDFLTGFHRRGKRMGCTIHRGLWKRR